MKENYQNNDESMFIEMTNCTREVVLKLFKKFRPKGFSGRKKLIGSLLEYFDHVSNDMKKQGFEQTGAAKELRKDLTAVLFALVAEYDSGNKTEAMTATKITGLLIEYGLQSFGVPCKFFLKPIEHERENFGQSLN